MINLQWSSPQSIRAKYCSAGKFVCGHSQWRHQKRRVDTFVLFLGSKGTVHLRQGDQGYLLEPDGYLILLADTEHEGTLPSSPEYYWCHFRLSPEVVISSETKHPFSIPIQGKLSSPEAARLLFCQMADSSAPREEASQALRDRLLEALLLRLLRSDSPKEQSPLVSNVVQYLRLNATQIPQVQEVAEHFGYNKEYLTTLLRRATGKTIWEHILFFRTEKAKELLLKTDQSVAAIAYACGFHDEKYFFRQFRKQVGLSPARYRKQRPPILWNDR